MGGSEYRQVRGFLAGQECPWATPSSALGAPLVWTRRGWLCQGVGSLVSASNNQFIVTVLFVFSVFCLTWQRVGKGQPVHAGLYWVVPAATPRH